MNNQEEIKEKDFQEIERNGSLVYVEDRGTGERDWVDYRDVDGWNC